MKNKKQDGIWFGYFWIIMIVVWSMSLVWLLSFAIGSQEPHFKITVEECVNETILYDIPDLCKEYKCSHNPNNNCIECPNIKEIVIEEVCTQKEVDKIEFKREDLGVILVATTNKDSMMTQLITFWFYNNCECKSTECVVEISSNFEEFDDRLKGKGIKDCNCIKYKCPNKYFVEVWNQIK